ncbi:RES family NAD+ phosphorylase [Sphingobium sp.]|uniref:RES family NAD+ phosphorylase n=1 Tax=Sphingobium sp. TaxID=1912891 RepID=UPI002D80A593|nr:RES domain-containing protein [Sphingobium sp.]
MTGGRTDRILTAYRIGDPDGVHPVYDSEGARLYPGRWNTSLSPIIYTSEHYSTAMLEKLVHAGSVLPPNQHHIRITIPNGIRSHDCHPRRWPSLLLRWPRDQRSH